MSTPYLGMKMHGHGFFDRLIPDFNFPSRHCTTTAVWPRTGRRAGRQKHVAQAYAGARIGSGLVNNSCSYRDEFNIFRHSIFCLC